MDISCYPVSAIAHNRQVFCLWLTNDVDGVALEAGEVRTFKTIEDCQQYAAGGGWVFESNVTTLDFGAAAIWFDDPQVETIDSVLLLSIWNFVEDYLRSKSPGGSKFALEGHHVYNKLFHANKLPAMQYPEDADDEPIAFTEDDRDEIARTLSAAFRELYESLFR